MLCNVIPQCIIADDIIFCSQERPEPYAGPVMELLVELRSACQFVPEHAQSRKPNQNGAWSAFATANDKLGG